MKPFVGHSKHLLNFVQWLKCTGPKDKSLFIFPAPELGIIPGLPLRGQLLNVTNKSIVDEAQISFAGGDSVGRTPTEVAVVHNWLIELGEVLALVMACHNIRGFSMAYGQVIGTAIAVYCAVAKLIAITDGS